MTHHKPSLRQTDWLDPARAGLVQAALDLPGRVLAGDSLPPFFHQLYFWDPQPPSGLGRDGHPKVGGIIPDMGLPRRMWAGGRLQFHAPLVAGAEAEKTTICEASTHKTGRTGPLGFVTLRHEITQNGQLCVTEWQDLVYREDPASPGQETGSGPDPETVRRAGDTPATGTVETASRGPVTGPALAARPPKSQPARTDAAETRSRSFDTTLLFRYSAATCNGHRIHYDLDYAQTVEGYTGLVVHGPLLAQCLMLIAEEMMGSLGRFSFRAHSPVMHHETAILCHAPASEDLDLWVAGPDGRLAMSATAAPG